MAYPDFSQNGLSLLGSMSGSDGRLLVIYRSQPNYTSPISPPDWPGYEVWLAGNVVGARYAVIYRSSLAPQLPAITRIVADRSAASRGTPAQTYSVNRTADQVWENLHVEGYEQNGVAQSYKGGLTIRNCRFVDGWSDGQFSGQGVYSSAIPGPITVTDSLFGWNGRPRFNPNFTPTMFRHGWYGQGDASSPTFDRCIFVGNGNVGPQFRNGGKISNSLLIDNGTGILGVMGDVVVENCLILSGHLYFDGSNWTGGSAIMTYTTLTVNNTMIVGTVGQCTKPGNDNHPGSKCYPQVAVSSGGAWFNHDHPPFVPPPDGVPLIRGSGNLISGWGTAPFGGPRPHNGSGFTVQNKAVDYDWTPTVNQVLANQISVPDAISLIKADVSKLVS